MAFFLLLFAHAVLSLTVAGVQESFTLNLQCTNDLERMFCQLEEKNCLEYILTLQSDSGYGTESCILQQCDTAKCCCDVKMTLIIGESHTARVQEGDNILGSKTISVTESFKPKIPTIISVNETKDNFGVRWRTDMEIRTDIELTAQMMFYKKGGAEKPWNDIRPATVDGVQYYEISGKYLERSTAYVVRVRSVAGLNNIASDGSKEWEFRTPASHDDLHYTLAIVSSIAAVLISIGIYYCYKNLKKNWWDKLPKPNINQLGPVNAMMLQPEESNPLPVHLILPITNDRDQFSQDIWSESNYKVKVGQPDESPDLSFMTSTVYSLHLPNICNNNSDSIGVQSDFEGFIQMLKKSQNPNIQEDGFSPLKMYTFTSEDNDLYRIL